MGMPRPYYISGHNPNPGTDVTKYLKSIYGHDDALVAVWLMVKEFPAPDKRTTKYGPPRCNIIHHLPPSRAHDDSKRKGDIHSDIFSSIKKRPTSVLKNSKNKKNKKKYIIYSRTCLVFIMYQFIYNPRVKSIKVLIFFENPLISSSTRILFHYYRFNEKQDLC